MNKYVIVIASAAKGVEKVMGDFWTQFSAQQWLDANPLEAGQSALIIVRSEPELQGVSH